MKIDRKSFSMKLLTNRLKNWLNNWRVNRRPKWITFIRCGISKNSAHGFHKQKLKTSTFHNCWRFSCSSRVYSVDTKVGFFIVSPPTRKNAYVSINHKKQWLGNKKKQNKTAPRVWKVVVVCVCVGGVILVKLCCVCMCSPFYCVVNADFYARFEKCFIKSDIIEPFYNTILVLTLPWWPKPQSKRWIGKFSHMHCLKWKLLQLNWVIL